MLEEKTNPHLVDTVLALKQASSEHEAPVWRALAEQLEKPSRVHPDVNVGELQRVADDDASIVAVPGKVLGGGYLDRELTVAAWNFSGSAEDKIEDAGGSVLTLSDALDENPDGENVQVVG
ncbi:50S ribosomal protein L18e [Thermoplasmatales archaeon SW_10_69_26]|jgi:large subunit ribosomal protein L18e|nr:MAG: 50S ribosomal protein L18e [Thermoplasmatales archaeon SW_10_69_26]